MAFITYNFNKKVFFKEKNPILVLSELTTHIVVNKL